MCLHITNHLRHLHPWWGAEGHCWEWRCPSSGLRTIRVPHSIHLTHCCPSRPPQQGNGNSVFTDSSWTQPQAGPSYPLLPLPSSSLPLPLAPRLSLSSSSTHFSGQPSPSQASHWDHSLTPEDPRLHLKISHVCPLSYASNHFELSS